MGARGELWPEPDAPADATQCRETPIIYHRAGPAEETERGNAAPGSATYNPTVSATAHRRGAPASVRCFVLTISDTRTSATDTSGKAIAQLLTVGGHIVAQKSIVKDDAAAVRTAIQSKISAVDVVITTGGTGLSSRDSTYEAITTLFDKRIDGFGELFRMLSYEDIGAAAMLSRACAGVTGRTAVFSLPGSEAAVRLAMSKLILPELGHVVRELRR
jgi:molybdopterin adenylyltransferase